MEEKVKQAIDWLSNFTKMLLNNKPKQIDAKSFFENYRIQFGKISQKQVDALNEFIKLTNENISQLNVNQWAYAYATTYHETNQTFEPIKEAYWVKNAEEWRKKNLRYYPYYGRGFVQLTWDYNYKKYADLFDVDIVENPDLVMDLKLSFNIMVHGMKNGTFTGKKIGDYISNLVSDYVGARRVINGTDKAQIISIYAKKFELILKDSIR